MKEDVRRVSYGKMLYRFRNQKGLTVKEICAGLCTQTTLEKFEKEMRTPDILQ